MSMQARIATAEAVEVLSETAELEAALRLGFEAPALLTISRTFLHEADCPPQVFELWHPGREVGRIVGHDRGLPPAESGILYISRANRQTECIVTTNIYGAWAELNPEDLVGPGYDVQLRWVAGPLEKLVNESPVVNTGASALRAGRMTEIHSQSEFSKSDIGWGLYRIIKADGTGYVGISANVHRRLGEHSRAGRLDLAAGDHVSVAKAKPGATWLQLRQAEEAHIARLKGREIELLNITGGGNGMPPRIPVNLS
jgi:hypothetical protein